jgi:hypothetical protein
MRDSVTRKLPCRRRQASILICVLVCLAVATALVVQTTHSALRARRDMRTERQLRQTELLLEAGVQRAAQRLAANVEYSGETWILSPESIPGSSLARIEITVPSLDDGDWPRRVQVVAQLSAGGLNAIQRSYTFPINDLAQFDKE